MVGFNLNRAAIQAVNWNGIWQLTLGGLIAAGALNAWRKTGLPEMVPAQSAAIAPVPMVEQTLIPEVLAPEPLSAPKTVKTRRKTPAARGKCGKKETCARTKVYWSK